MKYDPRLESLAYLIAKPDEVSDVFEVRRRRSLEFERKHAIRVDHDDRKIEVQLRTVVMDESAAAVERFGAKAHFDLKSGRGPEELLALLAELSDALAREERGDVVTNEQLERIARLKNEALRFL